MRGIVIAALAAVGVALVVIALLVSFRGGGTPKVVPDVRAQRLDLAEARLEAIGLDFETSGGGAFGVVARSHWRVCGQQPLPGQKARQVRLIVDRECEWTVPQLTGLSLRQAEQTLDRSGVPYDVRNLEGMRPAGTGLRVCAQDPPGDLTATRVHLTVARVCELPDVTGMTLAAAAAEFRAAGVRVEARTLTGQRPLRGGSWTVCEQDPPAYEPASLVTLTVAHACLAPLPDVEGYTLDDAEQELRGAGVTYTVIPSSSTPALPRYVLTVCDQDPEAGAAVAHANLYVAYDCDLEWPGLGYSD